MDGCCERYLCLFQCCTFPVSPFTPDEGVASLCESTMTPVVLVDSGQKHYKQRWSALRHQHFPVSARHHLSTLAELPSNNVAVGICVCVRELSVCLSLLCLSAPCRPALSPSSFSPSLCVKAIFRGREEAGIRERERERPWRRKGIFSF